jgi:hypothetical protein
VALAQAHVPGQRDRQLVEVSQWNSHDLQKAIGGLRRWTRSASPDDVTDTLLRGALLHTDLALLAPDLALGFHGFREWAPLSGVSAADGQADQPIRPSATIWWCLSSANTLLMPRRNAGFLVGVNASSCYSKWPVFGVQRGRQPVPPHRLLSMVRATISWPVALQSASQPRRNVPRGSALSPRPRPRNTCKLHEDVCQTLHLLCRGAAHGMEDTFDGALNEQARPIHRIRSLSGTQGPETDFIHCLPQAFDFRT